MEIIWIMSLAAVHIGCFLAGARVARWSGTKRTVREAGPYKGDGQGGYPARTVREAGPCKGDGQGGNPTRTVREAGPYKGDGQGGSPTRTVGESEPHKEDIQQRRLRDLWHNIECYDGTAAGQREVQ